jgi:Holliday junction resolvase RusA-like endonuclease
MSNRKYRFKVDDIPPKNVKPKSMWNDSTEVPHLIEFRKKAYDVLNESLPLSEDIALSIKIYLPRNYNKPGDLDNFIKGICDGLSTIKSVDNPNYEIHPDFKKVNHKNIHPETFAMIEDDEKIVKITAAKAVEDIEEPFYEITVEGK